MLCRIATIGGAVIGWGCALAMGTLSLIGAMDDMTAQTIMLMSLSLATVCSGSLVVMRHQRPLGAAYEVGYAMGRRDAMKESMKRTNVSPIRRVVGGLSEFNREVVGR